MQQACIYIMCIQYAVLLIVFSISILQLYGNVNLFCYSFVDLTNLTLTLTTRDRLGN